MLQTPSFAEIYANVVRCSQIFTSRGSLLHELPVEHSSTLAELGRRLFGGDVALWLGHHLVSDQELADGCAAQKRGIEVNVEVAGFDFFLGAVQWCLVESHAFES